MEKREAKGGRKPFQKGFDPRRGDQRKAGLAGGRPRDEWKAWLRSIVDAQPTREAIIAILEDKDHPAYAKVLQWAAERGYGKESDRIEHSGDGGGPIAITLTRRVIRPDPTP